MGRRRFEHLHSELSVAAGRLIPRYALWLHLHGLGRDPENLSREGVLSFARGPMEGFLADHGIHLSPRVERRLMRSLERFDPRHDTPSEVMERLVF